MRMIFHHPLPVEDGGISASGIRPMRMLQAFVAAGYTVDVVAGSAKQRRLAAKAVRKKLADGIAYDFLYSESSTLPTLLTEDNRIPITSDTDFGLFRECVKRNVPIGVFYRDIYWKFAEFQQRQGWIKFKIIEHFYKYDLRQYEKLVGKLYLPSMEMADHVPIVNGSKFSALPPGHSSGHINVVPRSDRSIRLLYVGGMSAMYEMHALFKAVSDIPEAYLTICTREKDWLNVRQSYSAMIAKNIRIVHRSGSELESLYDASDVAVLFVKPHDYRDFAVPFKLFEYIGQCKPIITSAGTMAGNFVTENGVGWSVPYDALQLSHFLRLLVADPSLLEGKATKLNKLAPKHTWLARAKKVIADMDELRSDRMPDSSTD